MKTKSQYRYWTQEETDFLLKTISENTNNLLEAFRIVSKKIDRTEESCRSHWYYIKNNNKNKQLPIFMTVSKNTTLINGKNTKVIKQIPNQSLAAKRLRDIWQKLCNVFK